MALTYDEFSRLVLAEIDSVHRVARSLARDQAEADDLVQETYVRAIQAWQGFTLRDHGVRPWLLRILHNALLNRVAKRSREHLTGDEFVLENAAAASASAGETTDASAGLDWNQVDARLAHAVAKLPDSLRTTLVLWAIEELSYQQIADVMSVPIGTVMSRLFRARAALRDRLASLADERGIRHPAGGE